MEVALSPELEDLITEQVESGSYPSPGEVVRDALRTNRCMGPTAHERYRSTAEGDAV